MVQPNSEVLSWANYINFLFLIFVTKNANYNKNKKNNLLNLFFNKIKKFSNKKLKYTNLADLNLFS